MGSSLSTVIRIRNNTNSDITSVSVHDVDSFHFGNSRPDKVFNGSRIPAMSCLERTIDLSTIVSNCPFTTRLKFENGTEDVFRMNYKCVFDDTETNFRHLTRSHRIHFRKTGPRVLEVLVDTTQEQKDNEKAQQLINDGYKLMGFGRYNEAADRFMEAAKKANESDTISALQKHSEELRTVKEMYDIDRRSRTLNNEGLEFLKSFKFYEALRKFEEALRLAQTSETVSLIEDNLKIAKDAKMNQDAKKLNQEGLLLRRDHQNNAAVHKFDEALIIAVDKGLIDSIKINKAETLSLQAKETLRKAWMLEMSSSQEAIHTFAKAKFLFQQAETVKPNSENLNNVAVIDCKIEGRKHYCAAVQLECEGSRLIDKTVKSELSEDCRIAKNKYEEAWKHYKEALSKFQEGRKKGDCNFERCLGLTKEALHGTERILNELEKAELEIALGSRLWTPE